MATIIGLPFIAGLLLQIPSIQLSIVHVITQKFTEQTGHLLEVGGVNIDWWDQISLDSIALNDAQQGEMLSVKHVQIDFNLWNLLFDDTFHQDELVLDNPVMNFHYLEFGDTLTTLNINYFTKSLIPKNKKNSKPIPEIYISKITINHAVIKYDNKFRDRYSSGLDPNHFVFYDADIVLKSFQVVNGTIDTRIAELKIKEENSQLVINPLSANFKINQNQMIFSKLSLTSNNTYITDSLAFEFKSFNDFKYFNDSVRISARLTNSHIHKDEIIQIFPKVNILPDELTISGDFQGYLSDFQLTNFTAYFGKHSKLVGNLALTGLPVAQETLINAQFSKSTVTISDLQDFLPIAKSSVTNNLGLLQLDGRFFGYINDFVANGNFTTAYGTISSDLNLKFPDKGLPTYSGNLILQNFSLGKLLKNPDLNKINFNGRIVGNGWKLDQSDIEVDGTISSLDFRNYSYKDIHSKGKLSNQLYKGFISINDPNLQFSIDGIIDLHKNKEFIDVNTRLDTLNLKALGFTNDEFNLKGEGKLNFSGLNIDSMIVDSHLMNVTVKSPLKLITLDTISIHANFEDSQRKLVINSELADFEFKGHYQFSSIFRELNDLIKDYKSIVLNDSTLYAQTPQVIDTSQHVTSDFVFSANIKSLSPILNLYDSKWDISNGLILSGNYRNDKTSIINVSTFIDTLHYGNIDLYNNTVEINSSKNTAKEVLAMFYLESESQKVENITTENMFAEAVWDNKHIDFELNLDQKAFENTFNLKGNLDFLPDSTLITMDNSDIRALNIPWNISKNGRISIKDKVVNFYDLALKSENQGLIIDGSINSPNGEALIIAFDSLKIENFNSLINKKLSGKLNGEMLVYDVFQNTAIENDLTISDFYINNLKVGDAAGVVRWNKEAKQFDIRFTVLYNKMVTMELEGFYDPTRENPLYIDADLVNAQINILEPFIGSYFTNLGGTATGDFNISGSLLKPRIFGKGVLNGGKMTIAYLKTPYFVDGTFSFSEDKIFLDDINVKDRFNNGGKLRGVINHGGFRNMSVNLDGNFNKIEVLNTNSGDNSWFYGQGFGTGTISFIGPVNNINISVNAKTEKGTKIYIPIEGTEIASSAEFINFTNFYDTLKTDQAEDESVTIKGINMDFNLDITTDAYCEIIFDIKAGDIIRGRGTGELNLNMNANGEFTMFGPLNITEGWYNFTLYNLINKEFNIVPGGLITWYGDPYKGIMDLKATYKQNASFEHILNPIYQGAPELKRKYTANVEMGLTGPLLNPEISFDIKAEDLPRSLTITPENSTAATIDLDFEFQSIMKQLDEQELNRQVFSLIVLKSFSKPEIFNYVGAFNSVSELFSNQLSYWLSQMDDNLEVDFDVDLSNLSPEAFNTFQLRLSYTFMNGRLRVTRDGTFTDQEQDVNFSSLAGNWMVEYLLTQDGKLKVKMYNRTILNDISTNDQSYNGTTGVSLQYTQQFNEFIKEMTKVFVREKKKEEQSKKPIPPGEAVLNNEDE